MMKTTRDRARVTDTDRWRLGRLLACDDSAAWGSRRQRGRLEWRLEQAQAVDSRRAPNDLVTMNSTVILANPDSQARRTVTLAYPDELDLAANSISVLEPLGVALLGRAVGDMIECPAERCQQQFHVADVVRQPERVGAWHL